MNSLPDSNVIPNINIPQIVHPSISNPLQNQQKNKNSSAEDQMRNRSFSVSDSTSEDFSSTCSISSSRRTSFSSSGRFSSNISAADFPKHTAIKPSQTERIDGSNIQSSIDKQSLNTEIIIPQGEFKESITLYKQVLISGEKSVIISNGKDDTIHIKTSIAQIKGITFKQIESQASGSLLIENGDVLFEDCTFYSVLMPSVIIKGSSRAFFVNCNFTAKESCCVLLNQSSFASFSLCNFNSSVNGCVLRQSAIAHFANCKLENIAQTAIQAYNTSKMICDNCSFKSCKQCCIDCKTSSKFVALKQCSINDCNAGISVLDSTCAIVGTKMNNIDYIGLEVQGLSQVSSESNEFGDCNGECCVAVHNGAKLMSINDSFSGRAKVYLAAFGNSSYSIEEADFHNILGNAIVSYNNSKGTISASSFTDITNTAIMCYSNASVTVDDSNIKSVGNNAIYFKKSSTSKLSTVTFTENKKNCVVIENVNDGCIVDKCTFNSNKANAIFSMNSVFQVSSTSFQQNSVAINGKKSKASISGCKLQNNVTAITLNGCQTQIKDLEIAKNENSLVFSAGTCDVQNTNITESKKYGIFASAAAECIFNNVIAKDNSGITVVTSGADTSCTFDGCSFNNNSTCFHVSSNSKCTTNMCKITGGALQVDVSGATFNGNNDEFTGATGSAAIHIHDKATANLDKCTVSECNETGIISSANLSFTHSQLTNCKKIGGFMTGESSGNIQKSVIQSNGDCGIYFEDGNCGCLFNQISGHKISGIRISSNASPEVRGNDITNNGSANIDRE